MSEGTAILSLMIEQERAAQVARLLWRIRNGLEPDIVELIGRYLDTLQLWEMAHGQEPYSALEIAKLALSDAVLKALNLPLHPKARASAPIEPSGVYRKEPIPEATRWTVFQRDGFRCRICGSQEFLRADHIIPESKGGPTTIDNLQTLCRSCNSRKGNKSE